MKKFDSIFDILGPDMVGPSSSHTAGAARIGNVSKSILNDEIIKIKVWLYNSFASTGKGHGTDKAIIAGVLGIEKSNPEIKNAFNLAKSKNIKFSVKYKKNAQEYPANYAVIELYSRKIKVKVEAESLGGALIIIHKIDGFDVNINGEYETLIITHKDKIGILSQILKVISSENMNVVTINSARHNKLEDVKTVITLDNEIHQNIVDKIKSLTNIIRVRIIHKIKDEW